MTYVRLSPRMQAIADMVSGGRVADIGCDHAFISIYLAQTGVASRVYAMDLRQGPLDIAAANIREYGMSDVIETRLSDGFDGLTVDLIDEAVISGMGGELITDILDRGRSFLDAGIALVLQPQSEPEKVRAYLLGVGYKIVDESMLIDDGKYYVVIKAVPGSDVSYTDAELLYGRVLIAKRDKTLEEYLGSLLHKNIGLMKKLEIAGTENAKLKIEELRSQNKVIEEVLHNF